MNNRIGTIMRDIGGMLIRVALTVIVAGGISLLFCDRVYAARFPEECDLFAYSYFWSEDGNQTKCYETVVFRRRGVYAEGYIRPGEKLMVPKECFGEAEVYFGYGDFRIRTVIVNDLIGIDRVARKTSANVDVSGSGPYVFPILNNTSFDADISGMENFGASLGVPVDIYTFDKLTHFEVQTRQQVPYHDRCTTYITFTEVKDPIPEEHTEEPAHEHNYEWQESRAATEDADGEMIYVCTICGDVKYREATSAYNVFNAAVMEKIRKAAPGATVVVDTNKWISFHHMIMDTLAERPDVTLKINFLSEGHKGTPMTVTIPAGADYKSLVDKNGFTGFLFLGSKYGVALR